MPRTQSLLGTHKHMPPQGFLCSIPPLLGSPSLLHSPSCPPRTWGPGTYLLQLAVMKRLCSTSLSAFAAKQSTTGAKGPCTFLHSQAPVDKNAELFQCSPPSPPCKTIRYGVEDKGPCAFLPSWVARKESAVSFCCSPCKSKRAGDGGERTLGFAP